MRVHYSGNVGMRGMMIETRLLSATVKGSLFTILITAISFLALSSASALPFTIDAPENALESIPFEVIIGLETSDNYDVKIFVHQGDKNSYISQVNDGSVWRSPRTYMKETFPVHETYEVRVIDFVGDAELCVRLRKTGASSFSELCQPISVQQAAPEGIEEENVVNDARIESPVRQESKTYTDPLRMRVVYAFMIFCAAVIGLLWFGKL